MNQLDDNGHNLQWTVTSPPRPWWHRGAATAAMLLLVNTLVLMWHDDRDLKLIILYWVLAIVLAAIDAALNKGAS